MHAGAPHKHKRKKASLPKNVTSWGWRLVSWADPEQELTSW